MRKKSVGNIIIVILMVLLSLAAVSVVSIIINKTVREPLSSPQSCLDFQIKNPILIDDVIYNSNDNKVQVNLKRQGDEFNIELLCFIIQNREESKKWCCGADCMNCYILSKGIKEYYFSGIKNPKEVDLVLNNCVVESYKDIKRY